MKLEKEHIAGVQTPPRKSYNPFESDDEDTNDYMKSTINGYDIKSFETTADSLTFHLDNSNLSWEEAILGHNQHLSNTVAADASSEEVLYRKDTELFTDKIVTECEVTELVFSYKDNGFHAVKDIGIDEGVPTHDKVWVKGQENHDSKNFSANIGLNDDVDDDVPFKEGGLKFRLDSDVENDSSTQGQTGELVKQDGLAHEVSETPYSGDKYGTDDLLMKDEIGPDLSEKEKVSDSSWQSIDLVASGGVVNGKKDPPQVGEKDEVGCPALEKTGNEVSEEENCKDDELLEHAEKAPAKPSIVHEVEASMELDESQSKETSVQFVVLPALQEPAGSVVSNALSYNSKVEMGSIILDFNVAVSDSENENKEILQMDEAVEKPPITQTMSRDDDDDGSPGCSILDCATDNRVHGETSFSAAMPTPASITYMGPNAHAGNISLRSESSAGSTRSFAFPVLQTEWNSSPVRMAKADQRHFRKQRGWVHSLVCCKF